MQRNLERAHHCKGRKDHRRNDRAHDKPGTHSQKQDDDAQHHRQRLEHIEGDAVDCGFDLGRFISDDIERQPGRQCLRDPFNLLARDCGVVENAQPLFHDHREDHGFVLVVIGKPLGGIFVPAADSCKVSDPHQCPIR